MIQTKAQQAQAPFPSRNRFRLDGRSVTLDRRIHAVRKDLADVSLAGTLFAPHYARAVAMTCDADGIMVHNSPSTDNIAVTQLLHGETFHTLDVTGEWAWGFCGHDGYVGYVPASALTPHFTPKTHIVTAASAPVFAGADIKSTIITFWPVGAQFSGSLDGAFIKTSAGFVHSRHARPVASVEKDWVAVAERLIGLPYVWGGRGHGGIDCSGLAQVALAACGFNVPRDTDLQRDSIGTELPADAVLQRGDVIFFPGHVGFMVDSEHLLHANAYWMSVVTEPLSDVVARLVDSHDQPITARRRISK